MESVDQSLDKVTMLLSGLKGDQQMNLRELRDTEHRLLEIIRETLADLEFLITWQQVTRG